VLGKKQSQNKLRISSPLFRSKFHQSPKVADNHAANGFLAPFEVQQVAAKQRLMSKGRDSAQLQLVGRKPHQICALLHGYHNVYPRALSERTHNIHPLYYYDNFIDGATI